MSIIVRNQYGREIAVYGKYSFTGSTEKFRTVTNFTKQGVSMRHQLLRTLVP